MMSSNDAVEGSVTLFLHELQAGGEAALKPLCNRYFPRLVDLAKRSLARLPAGSGDAEDAAQSALISFWQGINAGRFSEGLDRNGLWKLLTVITKRKTYRQLERGIALKRGGGKVRNFSDGPGDDSGAGFEELAAVLPTQELDLVCQEMIELLPDDVRPFAVLRLLGYRNREIAEQMNCMERTVERKLHLIRVAWSENMDD